MSAVNYISTPYGKFQISSFVFLNFIFLLDFLLVYIFLYHVKNILCIFSNMIKKQACHLSHHETEYLRECKYWLYLCLRLRGYVREDSKKTFINQNFNCPTTFLFLSRFSVFSINYKYSLKQLLNQNYVQRTKRSWVAMTSVITVFQYLLPNSCSQMDGIYFNVS